MRGDSQVDRVRKVNPKIVISNKKDVKMKNKVLGTKAEPEIAEAIEEIAKKQDRPVSYIVRQAILQYLSSEGIKINKPEKEIYKIPEELIYN